MKLPLLLAAIAIRLSAGAIPASDTAVLLHRGDSLIFDIPADNFAFNAARYGLDPYPSAIGFTFMTVPLEAPGTFSAWLDSVPFAGPLRFGPGYYSSSVYAGPVSVMQSSLQLAPADAADLFSPGLVHLVLRNDGEDVLLGLPPNTLLQDLTVSFIGGPLSVGGRAAAAAVGAVPEPGTPVLMMAGLLCCGLSAC